jgi:hypothetical protein
VEAYIICFSKKQETSEDFTLSPQIFIATDDWFRFFFALAKIAPTHASEMRKKMTLYFLSCRTYHPLSVG